MKTTKIECTYVEAPFPRPFQPAWLPNEWETSRTYNMMRVLTDEGIVGISPGPGPDTVRRVSEYLVGKDPFAMRDHVQFGARLAFGGFGAGIENALWDIMGKACGMPLYRLLGGTPTRFLAYASTTEVGTPEGRAEDALHYLERGYRAIKLRIRNLDPKDNIRLVEAVRKAVGDRMDIMVDANQAHVVMPGPAARWSLETAIWTALELQNLGVVWLEEPLSRYDFDNLARLCERVDIRIAGGESLPDIDVFKMALDKGAYDIIQPDAAGGITRQMKLTTLAEVYHKPLLPHTSPGSEYANMHVMATANTPDTPSPCVELIDDPPVFPSGHFYDLVQEEDRPRVDKDGTIGLTPKPGLGYEWDFDAVRRFKVVGEIR
jgi:D-galactarolactone cycloisomerase